MKKSIFIALSLLLSFGTLDMSAQSFMKQLGNTIKKEVGNQVKKEVKKAGNEITRRQLIRLARQDAEMAKNKPHESFLRPVISAVKCRMGYEMSYIKNMG